jgi:transposase
VVPEDTARVARAAFPKGNPYLRMHDELGRLSADQDFAALFPTRGQPAFAPAQLALVTLMEFAENLSDRQAAEAVRARIDWKYALCLELDDPGFDASVLCEFRARLLAGGQEALLFDLLLARCREAGLVRARGRQRTAATAVVAAIRLLHRLELVGETLQHALHTLAAVAPGRPLGRAAHAVPGRVGRALRAAAGGVPPAQGPACPPGAGGADRRGRAAPAGGGPIPGGTGVAAGGPGSRDAAAGLDAAVLRPGRGRGGALARRG